MRPAIGPDVGRTKTPVTSRPSTSTRRRSAGAPAAITISTSAPHRVKQALLVSLERLRQELSRGSRHGVEKELNAFLHRLAALHGVDSASIAVLMNQARILGAAL